MVNRQREKQKKMKEKEPAQNIRSSKNAKSENADSKCSEEMIFNDHFSNSP